MTNKNGNKNKTKDKPIGEKPLGDNPSNPHKHNPSNPHNPHVDSNWLSIGEVSKLNNIHHTINTPSVLSTHLSSSPALTVTRFPPEPNGYLHLGHAKAINLSFEYSLINNGVTYLRFDDTNPRNEKEEFYKSIVKDVEWLGFKPFKITYASDYFDILIDYAFKLIDKGKAYVCHLDLETMRQGRRVGYSMLEGDNDRDILEGDIGSGILEGDIGSGNYNPVSNSSNKQQGVNNKDSNYNPV
ncbi:glutamine--tRNA ligase, partial [Hamiltosporidium magnivora]